MPDPWTTPGKPNSTRLICPLGDWFHDEPDGAPTGGIIGHQARAERLEALTRSHLEEHPLEDWVAAASRLQQLQRTGHPLIGSLVDDYRAERQEHERAQREASDCQQRMGGLVAKLVAELDGNIDRAAELLDASADYLKVIADLETEAELHAHFACPGWEYETTEGQRKAWDRCNKPPEGEGWERNTDAGRDGWERFDYTEESYWRRPKAADA